jgi:hypothetical protein
MDDVNGAAALVNQVRARVNLPATPATTKEEMRLAVEKERRLELAFEAHRWHDLKRTGRGIELMNAVTDGEGNILYNITSHHLLFPVPQSEIDRNIKITQNDGY